MPLYLDAALIAVFALGKIKRLSRLAEPFCLIGVGALLKLYVQNSG
jgi:hypothetical protein